MRGMHGFTEMAEATDLRAIFKAPRMVGGKSATTADGEVEAPIPNVGATPLTVDRRPTPDHGIRRVRGRGIVSETRSGEAPTQITLDEYMGAVTED